MSPQLERETRERDRGPDGRDAAGLEPIPPGALDRLGRIRERLRSRAYESDAVRVTLARRLLASGDMPASNCR